ncbi:MAG: acetyl-CoA hydrolase/transferase family protein [Myxococcales bacterium]|nr:acetyl-CoA hydrolase/transferase family protein [Myxococcales bacterium]
MSDRDDQRRAATSAEVVSRVQAGNRVFVQGAAATPTALLDALVDRHDLAGVRLYHLHLEGASRLFEPGVNERLRSVSFFTGPAARGAIERGDAEYMPVFLSDIPGLFQSGQIPLDVAMVQLSPPDRHGNATLGTSCDAARAAVDSARIVIAEINELMPRTHGATVVPMSRLAGYCWTRRPLPSHDAVPIGPVEQRIGESIAGLIEDGSTLQVGIGAIPDAVLARLGDKNDLGVHTEMFSDGLVPLLRSGVVNNTRKAIHPGRTVTSFVTGSRDLFDFVDGNQLIELHPCDRTNDTALIRKNDRVVAINSALEIDLTGQVCADSVGHRIYSGIGGQMDFIRGAAMSRGGKPIIALASTAVSGTVSRIVPALRPGAGVVTTRGHVHWVATEYGIRNLHGLTLRERAEALISLAHPDFRAELRAAARALRHYDLGG